MWCVEVLLYEFKKNISKIYYKRKMDIYFLLHCLLYLSYRYCENFTYRFVQDIKNAKVFLGIGANLGYYANLANLFMDDSSQIHIFEPVEHWYTNLCTMFNNSPKVKIYDYAISNKNGMETLYSTSKVNSPTLDGNLTNNNHQKNLNNGANIEKIDVKSSRLDTLFPNVVIDVIKMDIEGGEILAFEGMENILEKRVTKIFLEYHYSLCESIKINSIKYFEYLLKKYDYKCYKCVGDKLIPTSIIEESRVCLLPNN